MGQYCQVSDIQAYGINYTFSTSSQVTLTQVNVFITTVESEINMALYQIGITVINNPNLTQMLNYYDASMVASMVLRRQNSELDQKQAETYKKDYTDWLQKMLHDKDYQKMLVFNNASAQSGQQTGSPVTNGFIVEPPSLDREYYPARHHNPQFGVDIDP